MSLVCAQCSRTNPSEAAYCYHDGAALAGRAKGPVDAAMQPFLQPYAFPNGAVCRNFDQFALACQQYWTESIDLLKKGYLAAFFGGLGRSDLARAADEAARAPDPDRALDQLLGKLPAESLQPPKLQVEPSDINLGQIKIGEDRVTQLHLSNAGMRLLYGTVTSECKWLTLGEGKGQPGKIFQFNSETTIPVRVRGKHLRAGTKPIVGRLQIESNGGLKTVTVRVEAPITPFAGGLFKGALTPRQVADKAKIEPREAAPYFENGDVARWYATNGWQYPVQGPTMPGVGGVQQFFDALGVAKPAAISFTPTFIDLKGTAGQVIATDITISAEDQGKRRVIYGWGTCDQAWVEIGKTKLATKTAIIPITLRIPDSSPPLLTGAIHVFGNGNQKAVLPIRVAVAPGKKAVARPLPQNISVELVDAPPKSSRQTPSAVTAPSDGIRSAPAPLPASMPSDGIRSVPVTMAAAPEAFAFNGSPRYRDRGLDSQQKLFLLVPTMLLCFFVGLLMWRDHRHGIAGAIPDDVDPVPIGAKKEPEIIIDLGDVDPVPKIMVKFDEGFIGADYSDSMTFAVHKIGPKGKDHVKLNWYPNGLGNSTVVRIDKLDHVMGNSNHGLWFPKGPAKDAGRFGGKTRNFIFSRSEVHVTQTVTVEPGEPVPYPDGKFKRPLNVAFARYTIHNKDTQPHHIGLRILLDTCIGENDGVPFTIPGEGALVSTARDFNGADVPDFVQVLEKPDLKDPGVVVHLNMRLAKRLETPSRFSLTRYPVAAGTRESLRQWDVPIVNFGDDSCVVIYWEEKNLGPNEKRDIGFSYGLGNLSLTPIEETTKYKGSLALTVGGGMYVNGELTVMALVADTEVASATLKLPEGLELVSTSKPLMQPVAKGVVRADKTIRPVPVTWRVRAVKDGNHEITVSTDTKMTRAKRVTINLKSLFN